MNLDNFVKGLQHIGIPTTKMNTSIKFYESLGFSIEYCVESTQNHPNVTFMKLNSLIIELYEMKDPINKVGNIDHIALDVSNILELWEIIYSDDYKILSNDIEFLPFWSKGIKFFIIEGPNYERIEFCQYL
ncbi:VOC family protein [Gracilibacillus massiliensis]|uniref:VOC family protein n=1 Tax=Gracilibacillus massiliensis TaxID=1564956 RepID=UPI00071C9C58|nr:VOC family protein [Gracilibacillus massiliensis]